MIINPYFVCALPIYSDKDIYGVANIISNEIFGGLPFGGLEDYIYDEIQAIYILIVPL